MKKMKRTDRIKTMMILLAAGMLLGGCAGADRPGTGTSQGGAVSQASGGEQAGSAADSGSSAGSQVQQGSGQAEADAEGEVSPAGTYDELNQSGDGPVEAAADNGANGDLDGSYSGVSGETLTISGSTSGELNFAFANSGISGSALRDGSQAVYHGDDNIVVVFNFEDGMVNVSVSSEEDYDVSDSPLIGTYTRD